MDDRILLFDRLVILALRLFRISSRAYCPAKKNCSGLAGPGVCTVV